MIRIRINSIWLSLFIGSIKNWWLLLSFRSIKLITKNFLSGTAPSTLLVGRREKNRHTKIFATNFISWKFRSRAKHKRPSFTHPTKDVIVTFSFYSFLYLILDFLCHVFLRIIESQKVVTFARWISKEGSNPNLCSNFWLKIYVQPKVESYNFCPNFQFCTKSKPVGGDHKWLQLLVL